MHLVACKKSLFGRFNITASTQAITLHLDALSYTLKDTKYEAERGNFVENKAKRRKITSTLSDAQRQESFNERQINFYSSYVRVCAKINDNTGIDRIVG